MGRVARELRKCGGATPWLGFFPIGCPTNLLIPPGMNRNRFLDYAKGLLILLVTIGHAIQFVVYQKGEGFWVDPFFKAIYVFHMPLFMGISGYLAWSGIQRSSLLPFTFGKVKVYLVPILAWATTYTFAKCPIEGWPGLSELFGGLLFEFLDSLWFIWTLFGCVILTASFKALGRWFWTIYVLSTIGILLLPDVGHLILLKYMYPFFQAGYALAHFGLDGPMRWKKWILGVSLALSVIGYSLWTRDTYIYNSGMALSAGNLGTVGLRFLTGFSASVLAVFLFGFLDSRTPSLLREKVESLGRDSIFIYIIQGYVYLVLDRVVGRIHGPIGNVWLGLAEALIVGVGVALASVLVGRMMSRSRILAAVYFGKYPKKPSLPVARPSGEAA